MTSRLQYAAWFGVPLLVTLGALIGLRLLLAADNNAAPPVIDAALVPDNSRLVGRALSSAGLLEVQSKAPLADLGLAIPDTAVVILLGGIGCSGNQLDVLRHWSEPRSEAGLQDLPVLAIYADPLVGVEQGAYESLILRRVSQAAFPFLVSQDPDLNLRGMGIRTPQVVLAESKVITHIFDEPTGPALPGPK